MTDRQNIHTENLPPTAAIFESKTQSNSLSANKYPPIKLFPKIDGQELENRKKACFDFDMKQVTERYMKDNQLNIETASLHERELKRFLFLIAAFNNRFQMRGPIDEIWHTFIMFTVPYFKFSREISGEYIHHYPEPAESPSEEQRLMSLQDYKTTWLAYKQLYGEYPPKECWPQLFFVESDIIYDGDDQIGAAMCVMCSGTNCGIGNCSDTQGCFIGPPCTNCK